MHAFQVPEAGVYLIFASSFFLLRVPPSFVSCDFSISLCTYNVFARSKLGAGEGTRKVFTIGFVDGTGWTRST
jgi:hypothetical protein